MAEKYKVVFRSDLKDGVERGPLWEPGCPLQIVVAQVSRNVETTELYLQLRLRNICARAVNSYKMTVILCQEGSEEREEIEKLDADIQPGLTYDAPPLLIGSGTVKSLSVTITELTSTGKTWIARRDPSPVPDKQPLELPERLLSARKRELDKIDATKTNLVLRGRVQNHIDYWVCACGQANVERTTCCECTFSKEGLRRLESEDALEQIAQSFEEDKQRSTKRRAAAAKKLRIVAVTAAALVAVGAATYTLFNNVIIPQLQYDEALSEISAGNYDDGIALLKGINGFSDSEQQIENAKEAKYANMFEYVTEHKSHDDPKTFEYLNELAKTRGQYYQKAVDLYDELYNWQLDITISNDENDQPYYSGESIAHIQIENAPLFLNEEEVTLLLSVQTPLAANLYDNQLDDWGFAADSTTLTFKVINGSINGQRSTVRIDSEQPDRSRIIVTYGREEIYRAMLED